MSAGVPIGSSSVAEIVLDHATGRSGAAIVPQIFADIRRGWEHRGQGGESCETGAAGMTWRASRRSAQLMVMPISDIMSS